MKGNAFNVGKVCTMKPCQFRCLCFFPNCPCLQHFLPVSILVDPPYHCWSEPSENKSAYLLPTARLLVWHWRPFRHQLCLVPPPHLPALYPYESKIQAKWTSHPPRTHWAFSCLRAFPCTAFLFLLWQTPSHPLFWIVF